MSPCEARDGPIVLEYKLAELPSSQHRAGLAGLVLMVNWLKRQPGASKGTCELAALSEGGASLRIDLQGLRSLLDQAYGASEEEERRPRPLKDKSKNEVPWLRKEERVVKDDKGKEKRETVYVYRVVVPKGAFLATWDPAASGDKGPWVKLWRDMVWSILRGVPATRLPFEARARGQAYQDADKIWRDLSGGDDRSVALPSTYYLGAQDTTAENVPFRDRSRWQLLLHFWPFVAQVYVPVIMDIHKNERDFVGYCITVPDVSRLLTFCEELPEVMKQRDVKMSGYRPLESLVDLPAESALDVERRLADRLRQIEGDRATSDLVMGYDVFHMNKEGNSVRMLSWARIEPDARAIDRYRTIRQSYRSPVFRRQRIQNLLAGRPWWHGYDRVCETLPHGTLTVGSGQFRHDAREAFKNELDREGIMYNEQMKGPRPIERLVYDVVGRYVTRKVKAKVNLDWESAKGTPDKERIYAETKEKIARDAFLAVRSRTGMDFADYFASSLCSVPQYLQPEEMAELSRALRTQPDEIRTMTMLALSAWS